MTICDQKPSKHETNRSHSETRTTLLRRAILSSGLSKLGALGVQALAIPLVYRALGSHDYALFLLLTATLATISLLQMGAGPGLTRGIAEAHAAGNHSLESSLFNASVRLNLTVAVIGSGLFLAVIRIVPPEKLFGAAFAGDRNQVISSGTVCAAALGLSLLLGVADSALAGYQEQSYTNIGSFFGNVVSTVLLVIVCRHRATIVEVILALYGVTACARLGSSVVLLVKRPYLLASSFLSTSNVHAPLLKVGLAFWLIQIAGVAEQQGGIVLMARNSVPQVADIFAIGYKTMCLLGAFVGIVTQPLWPAFADAIARQDTRWVQEKYAQTRKILITYSVLVAVTACSLGPLTLKRFFPLYPASPRFLCVLFALYFIANVWTHLLYVSLMAFSSIWKVALIALGENMLMLGLGALLIPRLGAPGMVLGYLIASLFLPAWILPGLFRDAVKSVSMSSVLEASAA